MSWTELLTYTIERHDDSTPLGDFVMSLAKNAPSMEMGKWLAADKLNRKGAGGHVTSRRQGSRTKPRGQTGPQCLQSQIHQLGAEGYSLSLGCPAQ